MNILVKQIYFRKEQAKHLSPSCSPFFNEVHEDNLFLEYSVILHLFRQKFHEKADYTGVFSWRFQDKTRVSPGEFFAFCRHHPGYDVYFINPFPEQTHLYRSVWEQGEKCHANLKAIAQDLFDELDYGIDVDAIRNDETNTLFSNYWIGNVSFWERYIEFTKPVYDYISKNKDNNLVKNLKATAPYHYSVSYIPFLMERLFSTLLWKEGSISRLPYTYSLEQIASLISDLRVYEYGYKKYYQKYNTLKMNYYVEKLIKYGLASE